MSVIPQQSHKEEMQNNKTKSDKNNPNQIFLTYLKANASMSMDVHF